MTATETCGRCGGTGRHPSGRWHGGWCPVCHGKGAVRRRPTPPSSILREQVDEPTVPMTDAEMAAWPGVPNEEESA